MLDNLHLTVIHCRALTHEQILKDLCLAMLSVVSAGWSKKYLRVHRAIQWSRHLSLFEVQTV